MNRIKGSLSPVLLLLMLSCGSGSGSSGGDVSTTAPGSAVIEDFILEWERDGDVIAVTMSAPTTGWIAVGFEPSSAMKDADIVIGYVEAGEVFLRDDWGDGYISHRADEDLGGSSNVTMIEGFEENGVTTISFSIPENSGDRYDIDLSEIVARKVIVAYGPQDTDDFQGYHAWAETVELEL